MGRAREYTSFLIFGLICNFAYSLFLAAATDLCTGETENAAVLCADVIPSFIVTMICPHYMHNIPYSVRIYICTILTLVGYLITCWTGEFWLELLGIILASISTGLGEITFLALTAYYSKSGFNGWGCGSGIAGVVSTGLYFIMRTLIGMSPTISMASVCWTPALYLLTWYIILPKTPELMKASRCRKRRRRRRNSSTFDEMPLLDPGSSLDNSYDVAHKAIEREQEKVNVKSLEENEKSDVSQQKLSHQENKSDEKEENNTKHKNDRIDRQETVGVVNNPSDTKEQDLLDGIKHSDMQEKSYESISTISSVDSIDFDQHQKLIVHSGPEVNNGYDGSVESYWKLNPRYNVSGNIRLKIPKSVIDKIKEYENTKITSVSFMKKLTICQKISLLGPMMYRYMICLFIVHFLSYTINTAIAPVLCDSQQSLNPSDVNILAQLLYRIGATITRSSVSWYIVPSQHLWIFMLGQIALFLALLFIPLEDYLWNYYYIFAMFFVEGFIDGTMYSHSFSAIKKESHPLLREFNMGAAVVANYLGIVLSAIVSFGLQAFLESSSERSCPIEPEADDL